ncbi:MAG: TonB-dependent receptor [Candidatus Sedimenticola endophacoides]
MQNRSIPLAALCAVLSVSVQAEERASLAPILVTASHQTHRDVDAPYASEVHTAQRIRASGATTLYDYLDKQTSLSVANYFGNRFTPLVDMRGFGSGTGFQNIVISLNGRRLNNIDSAPQLLGAIPLASIERIEITKGGGSVAHGDGATAGTIQIHTAPERRAEAALSVGNFGVRQRDLLLGGGGERFDFSLTASDYRQGGFADADIAGRRDTADGDSRAARLVLYPTDWLELALGLDSSRIDTFYPGPLSAAEFAADPAQNSGNAYTDQAFDTDTWSFDLGADLGPELRLDWGHSREDKRSHFTTGWISIYDYDYTSDRLSLGYTRDGLSLSAGLDQFDGVRIGSSSRTSKRNRGLFIEADYRLGDTRYSAGARRERVKYRYRPSIGSTQAGSHELSAWNLGLNHRIDERLSLFGNLNTAFQAPDIDRFFLWGGAFNAFIDPARATTLNVGANLTLPEDKLQVTLFHTRMRDEIYMDPVTYSNTNIDRSHKYGLELQETHRFSDTLSARLNYNYTRAIIDREQSGAGAYDGKDLPGISRHSVNLGLDYQAGPRSRISLSHTYRSGSYASEDFANRFSQRQPAYHSTDLAYRYRLDEHFELTARVENLFEEPYGIWVRDDVIYPVSFTRNWSLGIRASL